MRRETEAEDGINTARQEETNPIDNQDTVEQAEETNQDEQANQTDNQDTVEQAEEINPTTILHTLDVVDKFFSKVRETLQNNSQNELPAFPSEESLQVIINTNIYDYQKLKELYDTSDSGKKVAIAQSILVTAQQIFIETFTNIFDNFFLNNEDIDEEIFKKYLEYAGKNQVYSYWQKAQTNSHETLFEEFKKQYYALKEETKDNIESAMFYQNIKQFIKISAEKNISINSSDLFKSFAHFILTQKESPCKTLFQNLLYDQNNQLSTTVTSADWKSMGMILCSLAESKKGWVIKASQKEKITIELPSSVPLFSKPIIMHAEYRNKSIQFNFKDNTPSNEQLKLLLCNLQQKSPNQSIKIQGQDDFVLKAATIIWANWTPPTPKPTFNNKLSPYLQGKLDALEVKREKQLLNSPPTVSNSISITKAAPQPKIACPPQPAPKI